MEVELLVETPQNEVVSSTAERFTQLTSTSDRTRDSSGHLTRSDSDSGESLFITQSVSAAVRTLKRQRAARSGSSSDSDDQRQRRCPEDEDLEYKEGSLSHQTFKSFKRQRRHASRLRFNSNKFVFPFVLSHGRKYLPRQKQHLLENSEIGGFYKWIKRLQMDFLYHHPPKYLEDFLATGDLEDEEQNSDQEVTLVDPALFAPFASARNRHKWCSESILQRRIQDAPQDAPGVSFSEFYDSDYCGVFTKHAFCSRHSRVDEETQKLSSSLPDKVIQPKMTKKRRIRKSCLFIYDTDEEEDDKVQPVSGSDEEESHVLSSVSNSDGEMDASSSFTHDEPGFLSVKNIESYEFITDTDDDEEEDEIQQTSEPVEVEIDVLSSVSNSNVKTDATPSCTHAEPDSVRKKIKKSCLYVFDTDEEEDDDEVPPASEPVEVEIDVLSSVSHSDVKTDATPSCTHAEPDSVRKKMKKSCLYVFDTDEEEDDDEVPPASEPVEVESDDSSSVSNTDVETDASPSITHDELGSLKQKSLRSHEFTIDTDEEQDDEVQPVSVTDGVEVDVLSSISNSNVKTDANPSCTQANPGSKRRKIKKSCLYIFDTDEEDDVPPASKPVEPVEVERDVLPSAEVAHDESGSLRQKSVKFHEYNSDTDKDDEVQPASGADEMDVFSSDSNSDVETDASSSSTHAKPVSLRNKIKKSRMYISDSDEEVDDEVQRASGADEEESHVLSSDSNSDVETDSSSSCTHVEPGSLRNRNVKSHEYNCDTDEDDEVQPASGADEEESHVLPSDSNSDVETDASPSSTHAKPVSLRNKIKKSRMYISDSDEEVDDEVQRASGADEEESHVLSSDSNSDVETDASSSCTHVKVSSHRQKSKKSQEYISDIDEEESDEVQPASGPDDLMQCDADDTSSDKSESRETEDETTNEVSQSRDTAEVNLLRSRLSSACDADDAAGRDTKNESREVEDDADNKEQREDSVSRSWDTAKVGISTYRLRSRRQ